MSAETEQRVPTRVGAPPKRVLQGRYQLERQLGAGGMSTVYFARNLRFRTVERWCTVKEMVNTLSGRDPHLEALFTFHEGPLRLTNPTISPALAEEIERALQYDAEKRFASAREMSSALTRALGSSTTLSPRGIAPVTARTVYCGSEDGSVWALNRRTRRPRWVYQTGGMVTSSPIVHGDHVYIGSADYYVYALPV